MPSFFNESGNLRWEILPKFPLGQFVFPLLLAVFCGLSEMLGLVNVLSSERLPSVKVMFSPHELYQLR